MGEVYAVAVLLVSLSVRSVSASSWIKLVSLKHVGIKMSTLLCFIRN